MTTSRRSILKAGLAGMALPMGLNLAALQNAAAQSASDYKALVCVFLQGGNDHDNTVVPLDTASYSLYHQVRGGSSGEGAVGLALARSTLAATELNPLVPLAGGRKYAFHPQMGALASLFNSGQAAVLLNVGPLVMPITRAQYDEDHGIGSRLPPKLFSHNDQQSIWQASSPEGSTQGWGGHLGDRSLQLNTDPLLTCIEIAGIGGNNVFLAGATAEPYRLTTLGAVHIDALDPGLLPASMLPAFSTMLQQASSHTIESEYNRVMRRSIATETTVTAALSGVSISTPFPGGNDLADQLKSVARVIGARSGLGAKRQVFMVSLGGFDLHSNMIARQPGLAQKVSEAIAAFYNATVELGVANQVTTFTASDFGRTLSSNGDGSDHGWGGHHIMVGGAVKGRSFYGTPPPVSVGNTASPQDQWHVGQGRLLPSTSVDQYAATLARWFGVADADLPSVVPNIANFGAAAGRPDYPANLGFMA